MSPLTAITDYLLNQSAHIIVLFAVVASVCFALRKKTAHLRYLLWLIIIAKCLVPSLLTISLAILPSDPAPVVSPIMIEAPLDMAPVLNVPQRTIYAEPVAAPTLLERLAQVSPKMWFVYLWIAGIIIYALVVIAKAVHLNKYLIKNRTVIPEGLQNEFEGILGNLPNCYMVKGIAQPFVWGLARGSIYLPANFLANTTRQHRRQIVSHEAGHVSRFDPLVNLLQIIAQTVFFFHPLVWIANRVIRAEREKCCDEIAIAALGAAPRDYGSAIVETLVKEYESTIPIPSMAIAGPIRNIEDRIKTIMNPNKKFYKRPTVIALMTILLVAAFAIPTSFALTERGRENVIAQSDNLTVLDMEIKPIQQGKNEVYITVHNDTNFERVFAVHLYTRSMDYGPSGVGWGSKFFDTIDARQSKRVRVVYKIQGPVTENTWLKVKMYDSPSEKAHDSKKDVFYEKRYNSGDVSHFETNTVKLAEASKSQYRQASQIMRRMKSYIKNKEYDRAWELFTEDFQKAEYQRGIESFKKSMEPTNPITAAFHWDKSQFLKLKPKSASVMDGKIVLTAFYEDQPWSIEFVKDGRELKVDWIAGYRPAILDMQDENVKRDAEVTKQLQGLVEEFFKNNYRDVTARKTLHWSDPMYDGDNGNVSIRYKYEATIWDKDKEVIHDKFTFDKDGKFVSVTKIKGGQVGSTEWMQELVEDFFKNNYRDITARKTIEWGEAYGHDQTYSIRYKYEATIWDKDKIINNEVYTFDKDGKYVSVKKIRDSEVGSTEWMKELVKHFFNNNYRDITARQTIEWGDAIDNEDNTFSIRYKYEATIWDKDKLIQNKVFTFDKNEKYISAKNIEDKNITASYHKQLEKEVTVDLTRVNIKPTIQLAAFAICKAAGVPYQSDKSAKMADPQRKLFTDRLQIKDISAKEALNSILLPAGLHYSLNNNGLYLSNKKQVSIEARFLVVSQEFLDDIKDDLKELKVELPEDSQSKEFLDDDKVKSLIKATKVYANSKVLAAPSVLVWDGESAMITIVSETAYISGYEESDDGDPTPIIKTVESGVSMKVLPKIAEKGNILLEVDAEINEEIGAEESVNADGLPIEIPDVVSTSITSKVVVPDGGTVMFDGGPMDAKTENGTEKRRLLLLIKPSIQKPQTPVANK